jgi:hypothetical protein
MVSISAPARLGAAPAQAEAEVAIQDETPNLVLPQASPAP